jgi:hypothetical protein
VPLIQVVSGCHRRIGLPEHDCDLGLGLETEPEGVGVLLDDREHLSGDFHDKRAGAKGMACGRSRLGKAVAEQGVEVHALRYTEPLPSSVTPRAAVGRALVLGQAGKWSERP